MANRETNRAVEMYRRIVKQELRMELFQQQLKQLLATGEVEFDAYAAMTMEIDRAVDEGEQYGPQLRQRMVNMAGLDRR